jgi:hypothetical protein
MVVYTSAKQLQIHTCFFQLHHTTLNTTHYAQLDLATMVVYYSIFTFDFCQQAAIRRKSFALLLCCTPLQALRLKTW